MGEWVSCLQTPSLSPQEKSEGRGRVCTQTREGSELWKSMSQLKIMPIASHFKNPSLSHSTAAEWIACEQAFGRAGKLLTREIDWQITILLTDVGQDNYKRAE